MWKLATVFLMVFGALAGGASSQVLHDIHKGAGVECAACHQAAPPAPVPNVTCVSCHGTMLGSREEALQLTPDPHNSPHLGEGEVPVCGECHKIHGVSEVTCSACHRGFRFNVK